MTPTPRADAVIVAAGSSRRMAGTDKLSARILGRPVLRWSVETMAASPDVRDIVVVSASSDVPELAERPWLQAVGARVVAGGSRRQASVAAGVRATRADIVLVHDAARPLVSADLVARVVAAADRHGAAIPVLPVVDALKRVDDGAIVGTAQRTGLYRAQTPQAARRDLLLAAVEAHADSPDMIVDEAELLARHGVTVHTVAGEADNIKVTLPEDLSLARRLAGEVAGQRVAQGSDSHPFGPDDGLHLGGILIEGAPRLHGHSDGDVALHAVCDALLAAAGMEDLGRLFPSDQRSTFGIDSRELLSEVMSRLTASEQAPGSIDVTIIGARPSLGAQRLDAMAAVIAELVGLPVDRVSVKAATGNLGGDEGAGRVISATSIVSVAGRT